MKFEISTIKGQINSKWSLNQQIDSCNAPKFNSINNNTTTNVEFEMNNKKSSKLEFTQKLKNVDEIEPKIVVKVPYNLQSLSLYPLIFN